ncbi:hypothetical protein BY996DRAFT_7218449 [Phakopsora pachyrhizi]|nr:hypothetical protein BY996DRAFT_7218449 [Phakopsora pachyrhizi]
MDLGMIFDMPLSLVFSAVLGTTVPMAITGRGFFLLFQKKNKTVQERCKELKRWSRVTLHMRFKAPQARVRGFAKHE